MRTAHRSRRSITPRSTVAGFRFPPDAIVLAIRRYLRFGLSYRDLEELLIERGVEVDVTIYRWVLRSRRCLPTPPDHADIAWEIAGRWTRRT
jgi:IS6 family transposase